MPARGRLTSASPTSFNPRPPLLAGDAWVAQKLNPAIEVSIRARHCWRAMPGMVAAEWCASVVSIRARHCWRAMRLIANALQTHGFVLVTRERG